MPTFDPRVAVERQLLVRLGPEQISERSARMAQCELRIETLELERSAVGTRIKAQKEERKRLAHVVEQGHEELPVACNWVPDYEAKVWRLHRFDTGEPVETQPMTAADLQTTIDHLTNEKPRKRHDA